MLFRITLKIAQNFQNQQNLECKIKNQRNLNRLVQFDQDDIYNRVPQIYLGSCILKMSEAVQYCMFRYTFLLKCIVLFQNGNLFSIVLLLLDD